MNQIISWWSQPFRAEGDHTGEGIKNQLGRPKLGEFEILVREAIQNSWDARKNEEGEVSVAFSLQRLGDRAERWSELFETKAISNIDSNFIQGLTSDSVILVISDRGTVGLGGPIRSDEILEEKQVSDFVQFIRNVGEPRDRRLGGGTYGFGKGIFYRISSVSTILVDSKNLKEGAHQRRLMGASLTNAFHNELGKRFTGRHWWGQINDDVPDPILGNTAEAIADSLGLPGFESGESGTDIIVLLPDITLEDPEETLESLAVRLRGHIYWNLWPKLKTITRPHGINFSVIVEGNSLEMPPISEIPVLKNFANALDNIAKHKGDTYELKKYTKHLAEFSTEFVIQTKNRNTTEATNSILDFAPIHAPFNHIARMRQAELVVDYFHTVSMLSPQLGYVGVFRATSFSDEFFASSEPPTHDDWSISGLTGSALGIVRGANSFINQQCTNLVHAKSGTRSKIVQGLGKLSNTLGMFVQNAEGSRATGITKKKPNSSNRTSGPRKGYREVGTSQVKIVKSLPVVELPLQVDKELPKNLILEAEASIVLANGSRENPGNGPRGAQLPKFLGWFNESEKLVSVNPQITAQEITVGIWKVRYSHLPDAALRINIREIRV